MSEQKKTIRIIVAAGGTGGDLFPAVAVVEQLQKLANVEAVFVGNPNRIEAQVVPQLGFRFVPLSVTGYKGLRSPDTYKLPFTILSSYLKVRKLIREFQPHCALSAGTYISYPLGLAASHMGLPVALIESNAIPGKANRFIAKRASLIIAAFEECKRYFVPSSHSAVQVLGNPIRQTFGTMPTQEEGRRTFGLPAHKTTLLAFGGSLGARSINHTIESSLPTLAANDIQVLWQTGKNYTAPSSLPSSLPENVRVVQFIDDMASAYAAADLVLSRAGGGTVAELGVVGKPAILVPYPYAANNEQEYNARALEERGAAIMIRDAELSQRFLPLATEIIHNTTKLHTMAEAMQALGKPDAAKHAAAAVMKMAGI